MAENKTGDPSNQANEETKDETQKPKESQKKGNRNRNNKQKNKKQNQAKKEDNAIAEQINNDIAIPIEPPKKEESKKEEIIEEPVKEEQKNENEKKEPEKKEEEYKIEQPKKEEQKKEELKKEEVKEEQQKIEQPIAEQIPKLDAPKEDQPKLEEKKEENKKEEKIEINNETIEKENNMQNQKEEELKKEERKHEEPKKEEQKNEETKKEEPKKEEPKKEETKKEEHDAKMFEKQVQSMIVLENVQARTENQTNPLNVHEESNIQQQPKEITKEENIPIPKEQEAQHIDNKESHSQEEDKNSSKLSGSYLIIDSKGNSIHKQGSNEKEIPNQQAPIIPEKTEEQKNEIVESVLYYPNTAEHTQNQHIGTKENTKDDSKKEEEIKEIPPREENKEIFQSVIGVTTILQDTNQENISEQTKHKVTNELIEQKLKEGCKGIADFAMNLLGKDEHANDNSENIKSVMNTTYALMDQIDEANTAHSKGNDYFKLSNYGDAINLYEKSISMYEVLIGKMNGEENEIAKFKKLIAEIYLNEVTCYSKLGDNDNIIKICKKVIDNYDDCKFKAFYLLSRAFESEGQFNIGSDCAALVYQINRHSLMGKIKLR